VSTIGVTTYDALLQIEQRFCEWVQAETDISNALDHEPERLPRFPCLTMLVTTYSPLQAETGPHDDVTYAWRVRVYVALNDYRVAQMGLKQLVPQVLGVARHHATADGLCDFLSIVDTGSDPVFASEDGWLAKDVELRAIRQET
jgi:hypothetical protein